MCAPKGAPSLNRPAAGDRLPTVKIPRPLVLTLATVLCLGLAAGCSSDDDGGSEARPWPLTGIDGYPEGDTRQAITVKIENTSAGRPQLGIGSADIVVQELVEGGLTRLAVMFHSEYPQQAGPVRSMRETDIGLVLPTGGTLAASGGSGSTLAAVDRAGVSTAVEGDTGFFRDSGRRSPYNVMLDVAELGASLPPSPPPEAYLPFGDVPEARRGPRLPRSRCAGRGIPRPSPLTPAAIGGRAPTCPTPATSRSPTWLRCVCRCSSAAAPTLPARRSPRW